MLDSTPFKAAFTFRLMVAQTGNKRVQYKRIGWLSRRQWTEANYLQQTMEYIQILAAVFISRPTLARIGLGQARPAQIGYRYHVRQMGQK
jgi:hypothetical protein